MALTYGPKIPNWVAGEGGVLAITTDNDQLVVLDAHTFCVLVEMLGQRPHVPGSTLGPIWDKAHAIRAKVMKKTTVLGGGYPGPLNVSIESHYDHKTMETTYVTVVKGHNKPEEEVLSKHVILKKPDFGMEDVGVNKAVSALKELSKAIGAIGGPGIHTPAFKQAEVPYPADPAPEDYCIVTFKKLPSSAYAQGIKKSTMPATFGVFASVLGALGVPMQKITSFLDDPDCVTLTKKVLQKDLNALKEEDILTLHEVYGITMDVSL